MTLTVDTQLHINKLKNMPESQYLYTEDEYSCLLARLLEKWTPVFYDSDLNVEWIVLWRHDIDYSPQRALAIARLEAATGLRGTYFFQLRSHFYNLLEPGMESVVQEIAEMGHKIGLHFDPLPYSAPTPNPVKYLTDQLSVEIDFFKKCFHLDVSAFSLHNPTVINGSFSEQASHFFDIPCADTVHLSHKFLYISDSRGGWRRRALPTIIDKCCDKRLHVLTHPVRWTPEPCSIQEMLFRHMDGWLAKKRSMLQKTVEYWKHPINESLDREIQKNIQGK